MPGRMIDRLLTHVNIRLRGLVDVVKDANCCTIVAVVSESVSEIFRSAKVKLLPSKLHFDTPVDSIFFLLENRISLQRQKAF